MDGLGVAELSFRTGDSGRGRDVRRICRLPVVADLAGPTDLLKSGVGGVDFCIVLTLECEGRGVYGDCSRLMARSTGRKIPDPAMLVSK